MQAVLKPGLRKLAIVLGTSLALGGSALAQTTLRVVPQGDLTILDPVWSSANVTLLHGYMIYDTLFSLDADFEPQPQMVGEHSVSEDGRTYEFTLRPGLKWHDGKPVTSADVVASLQRWGKIDDEGKLIFSITESLEPSGENSVRWVLTQPYSNLLRNLAKIAASPAFIMPAEVAASDPGTPIESTIGSGPFVFQRDEWAPGSKVIYTRNEDYVPRDEPASMLAGGKRAEVDRVEWVYIGDPVTEVSALQSGEIDLIEIVAADLVPQLRNDANIVAKARDPLGSMLLMRPNTLHPPFNHPKGRQALLYLDDQEAYMTAMMGDDELWSTCDSLLYCGTSSYSNAGEIEVGGEPDIEKARQLFQEAGYKGELVAVLQATDHATSVAAEVAADYLRQAGLNVELRPMTWSQLLATRSNKSRPEEGGWSLFMTRWEGALINPMTFSAIGTGCESAWFGWPCDEEVERLRREWALEGDPARQKETLDKLHARLVEVVPIVNLGLTNSLSAWRNNVTGVIDAPVLVLWNVGKN
jgi:peptide/nickel transport system substrate-binding protein